MSTTATDTAEKSRGPRSQKGLITRSRLLQAAKAIFEENGFLDARISDITERARLSRYSFYNYFESKEEIFREVAALQQERMTGRSVEDSHLLDRSAAMTLHDRLRESNNMFLAEYRDQARIMGVIEQVSRHDEAVGSAVFAAQKGYVQRTADAIRSLQRAGLADPSLDPGVTAWALAAMVNRFAEMWFVQHRIECEFEHGVDQITTICRNALGISEKVQPVSDQSGPPATPVAIT